MIALPAAADAIDPDDFLPFDADQARIGQLLFYDKILSGNRNISCGTCHHHSLGSSDGLSLGIGEGGAGLGADRTPGTGADRIQKRVPRNAPGLWNLAHRGIQTVFHDGRLQKIDDDEYVFDSPAGSDIPMGLNSIIAAQALFPMTSDTEMAGSPGENDVATAVAAGVHLGWPILARRVATIPAYAGMFSEVFEDVEGQDDITIVHVVNALAAFIGTEWQSYDTPYDRWAREGVPLPARAERGRRLFFGEAGCAQCHNGPLFSDQQFHAAGLPAFGPGRNRKFDPINRDVGRMGKTDRLDDAYRFRTPSLRNVAVTAPYGHNGAYPTLRDMIRHMANPVGSRMLWRPEMARLPAVPWLAAGDFAVMEDRFEMARQAQYLEILPVRLSDEQVGEIEAFLSALTDPNPFDRPLGRPESVPSGLPVD
ncbi:cytochrome c peroxidase [Allosediminivita pacifica]|uniref:Cytochrome c peroxidase n=1 Tax=Allosediminivita pacifica TaxID=1267769 RepID=A0A2T6AX59_9RHOB|nr:cytochrome c peroxidase [Allosediminivita pacifica]